MKRDNTLFKNLKLGAVEEVPTDTLNRHPLNEVLFRVETPAYFENLKRDISEKGRIMTPLIVYRKTVLCGHNRLSVAKALGMRTVPVMFIKGTLSDEEQKRIMISDNLHRRHLSRSERIDLYRIYYPGFEERIRVKGPAVGDFKLSAMRIAGDTGLDRKVVSSDLRSVIGEESARVQRERNLLRANAGLADQHVLSYINRHRTQVLKRIEGTNDATLAEAASLIGSLASEIRSMIQENRRTGA